jgi:hypothetical protein
VEVDGKQVAAEGRRFALHKVDEYWPVFVSVRDLDVSTHYIEVTGSDMNHEFLLKARLETLYVLDDVFIVLELDTESAGKVIFLTEVGRLLPREPKYLSLRVPMMSALGRAIIKSIYLPRAPKSFIPISTLYIGNQSSIA